MKKILRYFMMVLLFSISFPASEIYAQVDTLLAEAQISQTRSVIRKTLAAPSSIESVQEAISIENGEASYYADKFQGRPTSSGEIFNQAELTAAHNSLPFGTLVKVTNIVNQISVIVKINDRGPFKPGRIIDLSRAAAEKINLVKTGTAQVKVEVLKEKEVLVAENPNPTNTVSARTLSPLKVSNPVKNPNPPKTVESKMGTGLFRIQMENTEGFGIQIGSYNDYKMMFHAIEALNKKGISNVMVHAGFNGDTPVYRLVIGPYEQKVDADTQLVKMKALGEEGLVLTLANLK